MAQPTIMPLGWYEAACQEFGKEAMDAHCKRNNIIINDQIMVDEDVSVEFHLPENRSQRRRAVHVQKLAKQHIKAGKRKRR